MDSLDFRYSAASWLEVPEYLTIVPSAPTSYVGSTTDAYNKNSVKHVR